jgi:hypothetical protein
VIDSSLSRDFNRLATGAEKYERNGDVLIKGQCNASALKARGRVFMGGRGEVASGPEPTRRRGTGGASA